MKKFDYFEEDDEHLDLTPLIDVIFMLLIFFIIAATFKQHLIEIILPKAKNSIVSQKEKERVEVAISKDGKIYVEQKEIQEEEVGKFLDQNLQRKIWLNVDKLAPFKVILKFIDEAKVRKYENLSFVVDKQ